MLARHVAVCPAFCILGGGGGVLPVLEAASLPANDQCRLLARPTCWHQLAWACPHHATGEPELLFRLWEQEQLRTYPGFGTENENCIPNLWGGEQNIADDECLERPICYQFYQFSWPFAPSLSATDPQNLPIENRSKWTISANEYPDAIQSCPA